MRSQRRLAILEGLASSPGPVPRVAEREFAVRIASLTTRTICAKQ